MSSDQATPVIDALNTNFQALRATYADLDNDRLATPDVVGYWSPKDVIGHIEFWAERAVQRAEARVQGVPFQEEDLDVEEINVREYELRKNWTGEQAIAAMDDAHARLLDAVSREPNPAVEHVAGTLEHYDEHTQELAAWRKSL